MSTLAGQRVLLLVVSLTMWIIPIIAVLCAVAIGGLFATGFPK
ncbi:hypothetical protein [Nocardia sp. alder85J]|nr:hypothetical protein [Nocardia sp. alder85J]MCX4093495.1 hypothetical protein [Nocardia sp. alder85J]